MKEKVFKFELNIKGIAYYEYSNDLNVEEARRTIQSRLLEALKQLGDVDIITEDLSLS